MFRNHEVAQTSEEFRNKYDSLIKEFNIEKGILPINYYPIFLLRRSIFGAIIVFAQNSPVFQLIAIEFCTLTVRNKYLFVYYMNILINILDDNLDGSNKTI